MLWRSAAALQLRGAVARRSSVAQAPASAPPLLSPARRSAWRRGASTTAAATARELHWAQALEAWPDHAKGIEEATTLPASWYTSPLAPPLEADRVFGRSWQLVGHAGQVAEPGQFFTGGVPPWRFVVARGDDGRLRAFHNVCRHHAAAVAGGCGRAAEFACPYHGWTYDLRGRLRKAPRVGGIKAFKASDWGLHPIPLDTWGPFVFLWFGGGGGAAEGSSGRGGGTAAAPPPLAEWLGAAGERMAAMGVADPMVHVARRTYELRCNWKVFCDNYLDGGYHVPVAHPGLAAQLDLGGYASELVGVASLQSCAPGAGADERVGGGGGGGSGASARPAAYFFVYPNTMVNRYGPWMDTNVVVPAPKGRGGGGADRCLVRFDWWLDKGELERQLAAAGVEPGSSETSSGSSGGGGGGPDVGEVGPLEFTHPGAARLPFVVESLASSHQVQLEDMGLCEAVQEGLEEPAYGVGRYAPGLEGPMFHFHKQLHAAMTAED